jgi:adenylylsulfate kinase
MRRKATVRAAVAGKIRRDDMNDASDSSSGIVTRAGKEARLGQRGIVIWLYGLSGAGKSTLAHAIEKRLVIDGNAFTKILDGDALRKGLNSNLGFDDDSRTENIRRAAEVAKLFLDSGIVTIGAFICPLREMRTAAKKIVGEADFLEVYVKASFETCARRDVKGLYAKATRGEIPQFTGRDSLFEEPLPGSDALILDTERHGISRCVDRIMEEIQPRIQLRQ